MKILIVDEIHHDFHEIMKANGHELFEAFNWSKAALKEKLMSFDAMVVRSKYFIDKELIDVMPKGFILARAGAGMDNIDEDYAKIKGIILINAPEGNRDAVAEHAIGMLLTLVRNINKSDQEIRQGIWKREENRGYELKGKTLGIIGYGNTGRTLAKKLSGFEMKVIAYDKYLSNFSDDFVQEVTLNELKTKADIISVHIPLTSETSHLLNRHFFDTIAKKAFLINTSRGKVIKTSDLLEAIKSGKIIGAALDVLENEQFNTLQSDDLEWYNELLASPKVILTSHIAGWTQESYVKISRVMAEKMLRGHN